MKANIKKITFASAFGTFFEWYDFLIYGTAAALVFNKLFFPNFDPLAGMLASILTLSIGFIARPFGAILFGYFGDRYGRRNTLMATMLIMGISTFAIGLLPTYNDIGIWAAFLLIGLRVIQGIAFGGEWSGASLMITENAQEGKQSFYASFIQAGYPAGLLTATALYALLARMPQEEFLAWGWRIPFLISIVLVGIGAFIRSRLDETPEFLSIKESNEVTKTPVREVLFKNPLKILTGIGLKVTEVSWAYVLTVVYVVYAVTVLGAARADLMDYVFIAAVINLLLMPGFGMLADKMGTRNFYIMGSLVSATIAYPVIWLFSNDHVMWAMIIGLVLGNGLTMAPLAASLPGLFPPNIRYTGSSLANQLAAALGGGVIPSLGAWAIAAYGGLEACAIIMVIISLITLVSAFGTNNVKQLPVQS